MALMMKIVKKKKNSSHLNIYTVKLTKPPTLDDLVFLCIHSSHHAHYKNPLNMNIICVYTTNTAPKYPHSGIVPTHDNLRSPSNTSEQQNYYYTLKL